MQNNETTSNEPLKSTSSKKVIEIKDLHKTYPGAQPLHVLKGICLDVYEGEMVAIMGASGSGKSTLLNVLGLLDTYDEGTYLLDGCDMKDISENQAADLRSRKIGFVFQSFNLITYKNAVENVALPLFYQGVNRTKRNERAQAMLRTMELEDWGHHLPSELSGGQKQRVAIARALVTNPRLLLADEPTGALDSKTTDEVMDLLRNVNARGITVVVITHEQRVADACHRTVHIKDGIINYNA